MSEPIRSEATKEAFTEYLSEHPELRFWQALYAFSGIKHISVSEGEEMVDPFYREEL